MKILVIMPNSLVGGAESIAFNLASTFLDAGHEVVTLIVSRGEGTFWTKLSNRERFSLIASDAADEKTGLLDLRRTIPAASRHGPFDLVYTSHVHMNALASLAIRAGLIKARFLVSRESTRIFDRFRGLRLATYKFLYRCYGRQDLLICQTEEMRASLLENVTLPPGVPVVVMPNPVNHSRIERALGTQEGKAILPTGQFQIVFAGRLIPLKRVDLIIEALAIIRHRDWRFTVLGEGEMRSTLEGQVASLGLTDKVTFAGQVANPYAYFQRADLGLMTSEIEGFPNVVLEMMASGTRQIIATPCTNAIRNLDGIEMLEDPEAENLSAAIDRAIERRPDASARYRKFIDEHHSSEGFVRDILIQLDKDLAL